MQYNSAYGKDVTNPQPDSTADNDGYLTPHPVGVDAIEAAPPDDYSSIAPQESTRSSCMRPNSHFYTELFK